MSKLTITDLVFFDAVVSSGNEVQGGALVPFPSTDLSTDLDTKLLTGYTNTGDLQNGFNIQTITLGSATGAAASAVSIFGKATAGTNAQVWS